ncbi:hypothetical protein M5236_004989 [Vibrio parahaemolyticus]|nr:hypothetical protein [Vibrio parahaemolyticus]
MKKILLAFFLCGVSISSYATGLSTCEALNGEYIQNVWKGSLRLEHFASQDKATTGPKGLFNKEKEFNGIVDFIHTLDGKSNTVSLHVKDKEMYDEMLSILTERVDRTSYYMYFCYNESSMTLLGYGVK